MRDLYGTGLRFEIETTEDLEVFAGTTYLLEHGIIESVPGSPTSNDVWHRSRANYGGVNLHVAPLVDVSTVTYLQPRLESAARLPDPLRLVRLVRNHEHALRAISASVWYDNRPPFGVRSYDVEIKNSLVVKLP